MTDLTARLREIAAEVRHSDLALHLLAAADRIEELEVERDRWKKAASGWARKWNMLECDFCGTPMNLGDGVTECENVCEDECLGPCGNGTGELTW